MQSGATQLNDWITRSHRTKTEVAGMLGVTVQYVSMLTNRHCTPGRALAVKIEALTGVPVASWSLTGNDKTPQTSPPTARETAA